MKQWQVLIQKGKNHVLHNLGCRKRIRSASFYEVRVARLNCISSLLTGSEGIQVGSKVIQP
jgi:hypothetical protein